MFSKNVYCELRNPGAILKQKKNKVIIKAIDPYVILLGLALSASGALLNYDYFESTKAAKTVEKTTKKLLENCTKEESMDVSKNFRQRMDENPNMSGLFEYNNLVQQAINKKKNNYNDTPEVNEFIFIINENETISTIRDLLIFSFFLVLVLTNIQTVYQKIFKNKNTVEKKNKNTTVIKNSFFSESAYSALDNWGGIVCAAMVVLHAVPRSEQLQKALYVLVQKEPSASILLGVGIPVSAYAGWSYMNNQLGLQGLEIYKGLNKKHRDAVDQEVIAAFLKYKTTGLTEQHWFNIVLAEFIDQSIEDNEEYKLTKKTTVDTPEIQNIQFADPATLPMEKMTEFHLFLVLIILIIATFVILFLISCKKKFNNFKNSFKIYGQYPTEYKKKKKIKKLLIHLEIIGTIIPLIILSFIASPSFAILYEVDATLEYNNSIKIIGHQGYWSYEVYDNEQDSYIAFDSYMLLENDEEFDPKKHFRLLSVDKPVFLKIETPTLFLATADDVIHSGAVPSFGIKMDTVPGRINQFNTSIMRHSLYHGQCSEICGPNHPFMPIVVDVQI